MRLTKRTTVTGQVNVYLFLLVLIVAIGLLVVSCAWAYNSGARAASAKWDEYEQAFKEQIVLLERQNKDTEDAFKKELELLDDKIKKDSDEHQAAMERAGVEFAERLRKSEGRAKTYTDMSQASAAERERLAYHAAELDRTVEEGRHLVRELRETVGQRDREIESLAKLVLELHSLNNSGIK